MLNNKYTTCRDTVAEEFVEMRFYEFVEMSALLANVGDKTGLELIHTPIGEKLLFNKHEGSENILSLIIGKNMVMYIMPDLVVEHIFDFVHDC